MATNEKSLALKQQLPDLPIVTELKEAGLSDTEIQQMLAEELQQTMEGIDFRPPRWGIEPRTQTFVNTATGESAKELTGVVVFQHKTRGYWVEGNKVPLCSSLDGKKGFATQESGLDWAGEERDCASCPLNEWGSDEEGRGKACKEMRRIYLLQQGENMPTLVTLPPTSISKWDSWVSAIATKKPLIFTEVILGLDKEENKQAGYVWSVIRPQLGQALSAAEALRAREVRQYIEAAARKYGVEEADYYAAEDEPIETQGDAYEPPVEGEAQPDAVDSHDEDVPF